MRENAYPTYLPFSLFLLYDSLMEFGEFIAPIGQIDEKFTPNANFLASFFSSSSDSYSSKEIGVVKGALKQAQNMLMRRKLDYSFFEDIDLGVPHFESTEIVFGTTNWIKPASWAADVVCEWSDFTSLYVKGDTTLTKMKPKDMFIGLTEPNRYTILTHTDSNYKKVIQSDTVFLNKTNHHLFLRKKAGEALNIWATGSSGLLWKDSSASIYSTFPTKADNVWNLDSDYLLYLQDLFLYRFYTIYDPNNLDAVRILTSQIAEKEDTFRDRRRIPTISGNLRSPNIQGWL